VSVCYPSRAGAPRTGRVQRLNQREDNRGGDALWRTARLCSPSRDGLANAVRSPDPAGHSVLRPNGHAEPVHHRDAGGDSQSLPHARADACGAAGPRRE